MYVLLTDETNMQPSANCEFFIYGGIFFPVDKLTELNSRVRAIRNEAGYRTGDTFKFDTRARPEYVEREAVNAAKAQVLELCAELGVQFIAHLILHQIVERQPQDQRVLWAADYVIARYNKFLREEAESHGICIVDNLPVNSQWQYLTDRYSNGLELSTGTRLSLDRIELFGATCVGASDANSVMDIVLGSFRYCVNNPQNEDVARDIFQRVVALMWHRKEGDVHYVRDYGLIVRPPIDEIRVSAYRERYTSLIDRMRALLGGADDDEEQ